MENALGVYDTVRCRYPLPIEGANDREYQTRDTARQSLDLYEIREDGTLWREDYDTEDRSDRHAADGLTFIGILTRVNLRWVPAPETVVLRFHDAVPSERGWVEWEAVFDRGRMIVAPRLLRIDPRN
jgi:hypothetical protein